VGGHNRGEGKNTNTILSNADNLDSRKIIPIVLKIVTRLDRELNCSSNGIVSEGNELDLEEVRWIYEKSRSHMRCGSMGESLKYEITNQRSGVIREVVGIR
jgi:hypothetical protein